MISLDFVVGCLVAVRRGMTENASWEALEDLGKEAASGGPDKPLADRAQAAWKRAAPTQRSREIRWLATTSDGRWQSLSRLPVLDKENVDRLRGADLSLAMVFGHPRKRGRVGVVALDDADAPMEAIIEKKIAETFRQAAAQR
jgi:hypothetical protein